MEEKFVLNEMQKVMQDDASLTSHPISQPVNQPDEIISVFDAISYKKGASILRMLNEFLGHKTFKQGLTRYLKKL
jgi:aminopeptidase N